MTSKRKISGCFTYGAAVVIIGAAAMVVGSGTARATSLGVNMLLNGNFEIVGSGGSIPDWAYVNSSPDNIAFDDVVQQTLPLANDLVDSNGFPFMAGDTALLEFGNGSDPFTQANDVTIQQTFTDIAGQLLQVSGWLNTDSLNGSGAGGGDWGLAFNGITCVMAGTADTLPTTVGVGGWQEYTCTEVGTGSDTLSVTFQDDPAAGATTNFSANEVVPEPASLVLLGSSLLGFGLARRRKRRA